MHAARRGLTAGCEGGPGRIQDSVDKFSPLLDKSSLLSTRTSVRGSRRIKNSVDKNRSFFKFFLSTAAREISLIKIKALSHNSSNIPPLVLES